MRPIDADAIAHKLEGKFNQDMVRYAPTLDYKDLVPQGEWVYHECVSSHDGTTSGYSCSNCSAFVDEDIFDTDEFHETFCGNCGARMK